MLIVALDFPDTLTAMETVDRLKGKVKTFKVGLELFLRGGFEIVEKIHNRGCGVFLDLKFHDIPNTVCGAAKVAIENEVFMYNVHTLGGFDFLKKVADFNREYAEQMGVRRPLLIGVTILTSMDDEDLKTIGIESGVKTVVLKLAENAKKAGLDGVVCSPEEIEMIKKEFGEGFITVTPGIRPDWAAKNDQKRVMTPKEAKKAGADFIVVGRPITRAANVAEAAERVLKEIS
ncbi:orotidine-5'-phosphate decarboxylase [Desulfurobacterium atlanticum]|uniref:Orotidine 5'-phosphate decarboxylase n=1 Tax=Desulfurobacterium atlanticum TaxID=240169 RepID=A0A238YG52_9BACT|nr:orotidine-5'-phosphate decarboxylase [Desulfurobacterium atlanticum]SNR70226.1 orotidine-5'-phosphate decarboxylase [Desulfurobacterium atlanticum]